MTTTQVVRTPELDARFFARLGLEREQLFELFRALALRGRGGPA